MSESGDFVVVWEEHGREPSASAIFGRRFDASGSPVAEDFQISTATTPYQSAPAVALDGSGGFLVVWGSPGSDDSGHGVVGRKFDATGATVGDEFRVNTYTTNDQFFPSVAGGGSGGFLVAWDSVGQDGSSYGVFAQRIRIELFHDGFEAGDVCAWSATVGGGSCP